MLERERRARTRYSWFLLALLLGVGSLSCAGSEDKDAAGPDGGATHALTPLDPGTLPALRDSFNAADDRPRILLMLSPT